MMRSFIFLWILCSANSANILVMLPLPLYSHTHSYMPIFKELANRGHNVTMVSPYPLDKPQQNFNEIIVENAFEQKRKDAMDSFNPREINGFVSKVVAQWFMCPSMIDGVLNLTRLKEFLKDTDSKFDLVITEAFFCQEPFLALAHKYGAVQVAIQPITLPMSLSQLTGNPYNPSYTPSFKFPFSQRMNFWQRSKNSLVTLLEHLVHHAGWIYMDYTMKKHLTYPGFENLPHLKDLVQNISLILVDNHVASSYPRPYLPNVIEVGGLTIKEGSKLPENLEKFMNESKDGVIYFSWGSVFRTKHMGERIVSALMSAFGKLKQRVLMKVDQTELPEKPENVMIAKWFPQASVLGHPNLRVFMCHGGIHGVSEALYHGVPILGTAIFADQEFNLNFAAEAGFSINIDFDDITEESLLTAFNKLLTNSSYKTNALKRSKIMKDRPLSALDNAIYWIEYTLRHDGAPHWRSAAMDIPFYQSLLLDVIIVWGTIFILISIFIIKLFKKAINICLHYRSERENLSKNKKD